MKLVSLGDLSGTLSEMPYAVGLAVTDNWQMINFILISIGGIELFGLPSLNSIIAESFNTVTTITHYYYGYQLIHMIKIRYT